MNTMDKAILQAFPLLAVPVSGDIPTPEANGTRYLVARSGLWREINLPWIRLRHQVGDSAVNLPYGEANHELRFLCGPIPMELVREFLEDAKQAAPIEIAGALFWNEQTNEWRYERRRATSASADHIDYEEVRAFEGEHLVVDIHSHGHHEAFFSGEDNRDDAGSMKLAAVVGSLDKEIGTSQMRLCMAGYVEAVRIVRKGEIEVVL